MNLDVARMLNNKQINNLAPAPLRLLLLLLYWWLVGFFYAAVYSARPATIVCHQCGTSSGWWRLVEATSTGHGGFKKFAPLHAAVTRRVGWWLAGGGRVCAWDVRVAS